MSLEEKILEKFNRRIMNAEQHCHAHVEEVIKSIYNPLLEPHLQRIMPNESRSRIRAIARGLERKTGKN